MSGGSCRFSVICIRRSPDPGNSLILPALLTRRPLTSPTSWVRWSRAIPPCPLWHLCGSPAPSFRLNRVGLLPLWSVSPTSWPVRQVWPSIRWPSFRPTRRTSSRKWTRGLVWLQKRKEPSGGSGAQATPPPPTTVWGARGWSFPRQHPRRRVDMKRPYRPAASANPGRSWP